MAAPQYLPLSSPSGSLAWRGAMAMALQAGGQGMMLIAYILLARACGVTEFGVFAYILAIAFIALIPTKLGQDAIILRDISAARATSNWGSLVDTWRHANVMVLVASALVTAIAFATVLSSTGRNAGAIADPWAMTLGLASVPILALLSLRSSALFAFGNPFLAQGVETLFRPFVLVLLGVAAIAGSIPLDATTVLAWNLVGAVIALIAGQCMVARAFPHEARGRPAARIGGANAMGGLWMLVVTGAYQCIIQVDVLAVGTLQSHAQAGVYAAANRIAMLVQYALLALQLLATPHIAAHYAAGRTDLLQQLLTRVAWLSTAFALVSAATILVFAPWIMGLFGEEFVDGATILRVLLLGQFVNAATGITGGLLTMTGRHAVAGLIVSLHLIVQVVCLPIAISRLGALGAAWTTSVVIASVHVSLAIAGWKLLHLKTWVRLPERKLRRVA